MRRFGPGDVAAWGVAGAGVRAYLRGQGASCREAAAIGADAVLVLTEWAVYRELRPASLSQTASTVILDGRNCLDREMWENAGWLYRSLGRP